MALLNKQNIIDAADIHYKTIAVPEWGGEVRIRSLTAAQRDNYETLLMAQPKHDGMLRLDNVRARFAVMSVVDDAGELVFTDADIETLAKKSASALGRIYDAVTALNAIAAADVEELAKN